MGVRGLAGLAMPTKGAFYRSNVYHLTKIITSSSKELSKIFAFPRKLHTCICFLVERRGKC